MNETLFRPHGVYCLIMTYDPNKADAAAQPTDSKGWSASKVEGSMAPTGGHIPSKFRSSSGNDLGDPSGIKSAPLVYLSAGDTTKIDDEANQSKHQGVKNMKLFMADFGDRRAQARFVCFWSFYHFYLHLLFQGYMLIFETILAKRARLVRPLTRTQTQIQLRLCRSQ